MRHAFLVTLLLALGAEAASASMLPPLDLAPGETTVAVGLPTLAVDHAIGDRFTVGLGAFGIPPIIPWSSDPATGQPTYMQFQAAALRASWRAWGARDGLAVGLTASAGVLGPQYVAWFQPALNVSLPLGRAVTLRATLGPVLDPVTLGNAAVGIMPTWAPNLEIAVPVAPGHEITLLGGALAGWRGRF